MRQQWFPDLLQLSQGIYRSSLVIIDVLTQQNTYPHSLHLTAQAIGLWLTWKCPAQKKFRRVLNSRKQSTHRSHDVKWKRLSLWANNINSLSPPIQSILACLFHLKSLGLSIMYIRVHLVAASIHHILIDYKTAFSHDRKKDS